MIVANGSAPASDPSPETTAHVLPQIVAGKNSKRTQNWILDSTQDTLFIIAAPLLSLALALLAFKFMTATDAAASIILVHVVLTVAHHMPTFIRVYGDTDLLRRFKWNFALAPAVPLTFAAGVLSYINYKNYSVDSFLYLYIMLALWDPWHFLRQHYGFMRIYDRHNAAPSRLAARMDWWICVAWFAYIMLASGDWLSGLLQDLYVNAQLPLVLALPHGAMTFAIEATRTIAVLMTVAYAVYITWCRWRRYFVSAAKLALLSITFGVMYLTYTPNHWILNLAPGWSFKVGFATVGIVHMTQYLAIVWRYNRGIAGNEQRARSGLFSTLHRRGGWLIGGGYVLLCVLYGEFITTPRDNRWLMSALLAIGFTSTLTHYYFDGFIWKVRHQQNRDALALNGDLNGDLDTAARATNSGNSKNAPAIASWWNAAQKITAASMLLRQLLYFGVPMTLLTVGAMSAWNLPPMNYVQHMYKAQAFNNAGRSDAAEREAVMAYAAMQRQLPIARKLAEIQPTSAREAELAFLIYNFSLYKYVVMPALAGRSLDSQQRLQHRDDILEAVRLLSSALERGGNLAHAARERLQAEDAQQILASWRRQVG